MYQIKGCKSVFYYVLPKSGSVEEFNDIWIQNEFGIFCHFNCLMAIEIKFQDYLRIVQANLFFKQMSARVGSNIERLWILITELMNFETIQSLYYRHELTFRIQSRSISDPNLSDIAFKNRIAWVWTTLQDNLSKLWMLLTYILGASDLFLRLISEKLSICLIVWDEIYK